MAMVLKNNIVATQVLHMLNGNLSAMGKRMKRLSTGMRIVDASDGPSDYAISENMRVRLRALEQNDRNVQAGISMLRVAEGGVQSQLDILRTIKEKVLDANNDTNTDDDRAIIQKEINQGYDQLNDIAWGTTYNGKRVLVGDTWAGIQSAWAKRSNADLIADSETLDVVRNDSTAVGTSPAGTYALMNRYNLANASVLGISSATTSGGSFRREVSVLDTLTAGYDGRLTGSTFTVTTTPAAGGGSMPPETYYFTTDASLVSTSPYAMRDPEANGIDNWFNSMTSKMNNNSYGYEITCIPNGSGTGGRITLQSDSAGVYKSTLTFSLGDGVTLQDYRNSPYENINSKLTMDFGSLTTSALEAAARNGQGFELSSVTDGRTMRVEFVNSNSVNPLDGVQKIAGSRKLDVAEFIAMGDTAAMREAFARRIQSLFGSSGAYLSEVSGTTITVKSTELGAAGDGQVSVKGVQATLSTYDGFDFSAIDYSDPDLAEELNNKGFRFYDSGKSNTWVNVTFSDMELEKVLGDRYPSGTATDDITTAVIDITGVSDSDSLAKAIYEQANAQLGDTNYRFALDSSSGSNRLILYDKRAADVSPLVYGQQTGIADGNYDNVVKQDYDIYANRVHIQGAPEAGQGTNLLLPQTTVDHIFCFSEDDHPVTDFNVMTQSMRDALLGMKRTTGIIDRGINYLLDAQTTLGAQISRMEMAHENIVLQHENLEASESAMRDADMAKEMTEFAKYQILVQASQAMLAQANQNPSQVLGLMQ